MASEQLLHLAAVAFGWGYLARALATGRFATRRYVSGGQILRSSQPGAYWSYCAMVGAIASFWSFELLRSL